ncbi:alpha/beta fold hydrolase, partial [Enterococcus faecalis]
LVCTDGANIAMVFTFLYPDFANKLVLNSGNVTISGLKKYVTIATYFQYCFCRIGGLFSQKLRIRLPIVSLLFEDIH